MSEEGMKRKCFANDSCKYVRTQSPTLYLPNTSTQAIPRHGISIASYTNDVNNVIVHERAGQLFGKVNATP
uniref:Uncharacterized protein n=1 Tax=Onchocerca volvulus TaxID=6282 RepID=A0A8R1XYN3_ONCVO